MGKLTVTFEAENQDQLFRDMAQFIGVDVSVDTPQDTAPAETPDPPKKKRSPGRPKKDKPAPKVEPVVEDATPDLDLTNPSEIADIEIPVTHEALVEVLRKCQEVKGNDVTGNLMEEYGGSIKVLDIAEENYAKLYAAVIEALGDDA